MIMCPYLANCIIILPIFVGQNSTSNLNLVIQYFHKINEIQPISFAEATGLLVSGSIFLSKTR